jgi:hypothetical protein
VKPNLEHGAEVAADFPSRLIETSAGWILLGPHFMPRYREEAMNISVFGPDGWAVYTGVWSAGRDEESLGATLAAVCGIPLDEAKRIADEVFDGWRSRGGEGRARREKRRFLGFMLVVGLVVLLALLGVVLAVWALVS